MFGVFGKCLLLFTGSGPVFSCRGFTRSLARLFSPRQFRSRVNAPDDGVYAAVINGGKFKNVDAVQQEVAEVCCI